jgi:AcrR family transcriptional regulator
MSEAALTSANDQPAKRHSGRRERSEKAILEATRELIAERGVSGLTIEGVAARSGIAKTTIYRRWRDRDELALAILIDMTAAVKTPPDLGDTRRELLTFVKTATRIIKADRIVQGLVSEIATKPHLARAYRERIVDVRLTEVRSVIDRGVARVDLRPDTDVRVAHELLAGPLFYRLLFSGAPLEQGPHQPGGRCGHARLSMRSCAPSRLPSGAKEDVVLDRDRTRRSPRESAALLPADPGRVRGPGVLTGLIAGFAMFAERTSDRERRGVVRVVRANQRGG